jgi:polar amino acid transport system substrate-binding protein
VRRPGRLVVALLAAGLLGLLGIGCGGGDNSAGGTFTPAKEGVLTVATSLPAPGFWDGKDIPHLTGGFEWGIANDLADRFGLKVTFLDLPFEQLAAGDLGQADIALAQISATEARRERMNFSSPYLPSNAGALTAKGVQLRDLAQAKDLTWVVEESTTEEALLHDVIKPHTAPIVTPTRDETLATLAAGRADAALLDLPTALITAGEHPELSVPAQFETNERLAVALPKNSDNTEAVSSAIRSLETDGTLQHLYDTYLQPLFSEDPVHIRVIVTKPAEG